MYTTKDTPSWEQKLFLIYEICQILQSVSPLEEKLYIILTVLTAKEGFGFNRAALFLVDEERNMLEGRMGVGPVNAQEAEQIWETLRQEGKTIYEYIEAYQRLPKSGVSSFDQQVQRVRLELIPNAKPPITCIRNKKPLIVHDWRNVCIEEAFSKLLVGGQFACVPLVVKKKVIGLVLVDNAFNGKTIVESDIKTLLVFANYAAAAIENTMLYKSLSEKIDALAAAKEKLNRVHSRFKHYDGYAAMGRLAAGVAHEIRNPLNAIALNIQIVKDIQQENHGESEFEIKEALEVVTKEINRLDGLVSEFLAYATPSRMELKYLDLHDILYKVLKHKISYSQTNSIKISHNFCHDLPRVLIDEEQIRRALFNVVLNAIQAMPNGGELKVYTGLIKDRSCVCIRIEDTGIGMSKDVRKHVFEPFYSTKIDGLGLGLPIVEKIVEKHGGEILINSKKYKGTNVEIFLPAKELKIKTG